MFMVLLNIWFVSKQLYACAYVHMPGHVPVDHHNCAILIPISQLSILTPSFVKMTFISINNVSNDPHCKF